MRELSDIDWGPALLRDLLSWARAGGDDVVRTYCQRIGLKIDAKRFQAFAMAYWLDYVCDRLQTRAHQLAEPLSPERNISLVLDAVGSLSLISQAPAAAGPFQLIGLFDDPSPRPQGAAQPGTPRRSAARASTANHDNSLPSGRDPLPSHRVRA